MSDVSVKVTIAIDQTGLTDEGILALVRRSVTTALAQAGQLGLIDGSVQVELDSA